MGMKLYQLAENYNNLYDLLENEEIPVEVIEEALQDIEDNIDTKFENIAKFIKSLEGDINTFKAEEKRLSTRRKTMENKIVSMKNYMLDQLNVMERSKIQANTFVIRKQKSPKSIEVYDTKQLAEKYLIPQDPKPDTNGIKADLKAGKEVKGAAYKPESFHIRIQ